MTYRENGSGALRSDAGLPWQLKDLALTLLLVALIVGLLALAGKADQQDDAKLRALARAERQRIAMPQQVAQAYERGLSEGAQSCPGAQR